MIQSAPGWLLSPAYDLLYVAIANPDDEEELALTLEGKKSKLKQVHFDSFGKELGLTKKQIKGVFDRFYKKKENAINWIENSFLSQEMKTKYITVLKERYTKILIKKI